MQNFCKSYAKEKKLLKVIFYNNDNSENLYILLSIVSAISKKPFLNQKII